MFIRLTVAMASSFTIDGKERDFADFAFGRNVVAFVMPVSPIVVVGLELYDAVRRVRRRDVQDVAMTALGISRRERQLSMRLRTSPIMLVVSIVTTILASTFLLDSGATQDALTAKEFERDLRKAHSLMKRKRWAKAREAFAKLLVEHREKPWVYAKRTELVADIKQCVFRIQVPEPKADDVVTGDLERWDARTGKLRVRYTPDNRGDIEAGEVQTHPLRFEGPYTVTFKGKRWPDNTNLVPMAFVFLDSNRTYRFSLGIEKQTDGASTRWLDCELMRFEGDRKKVLAQKDKTPLKSGKSFTVKIKVGSTSMSASGGGGSFLRGKKPRGVFGSIGFANIPWDEMVLEGKGDPGWIRSRAEQSHS